LGSVRIAFYAPLKPPTHAVPSGDRRVAGLLMDALERVAEHIELVSTFRSFDGEGDGARQEALRRQGAALAEPPCGSPITSITRRRIGSDRRSVPHWAFRT
jgi:hypothetical protein